MILRRPAAPPVTTYGVAYRWYRSAWRSHDRFTEFGQITSAGSASGPSAASACMVLPTPMSSFNSAEPAAVRNRAPQTWKS